MATEVIDYDKLYKTLLDNNLVPNELCEHEPGGFVATFGYSNLWASLRICINGECHLRLYVNNDGYITKKCESVNNYTHAIHLLKRHLGKSMNVSHSFEVDDIVHVPGKRHLCVILDKYSDGGYIVRTKDGLFDAPHAVHGSSLKYSLE